MDRATEERLSRIVMRAVDSLGYSDVCIRTREINIKEFERRHQVRPDYSTIIVGSKAEGTSLLHESDFDVIGSYNSLVCSDNTQNINKAEYDAVFRMETQNVPAGYTRLRHTDFRRARSMSRRNGLLSAVCEASVELHDEYYLSSSLWIPQGNNQSGPAVTNEIIEETVGNCRFKSSSDIVLALPCRQESMLKDWINRPRRHGWPSRETIQHISSLQGYVVPVGFKGCDDEILQWRICYTPGEVTLVQELNHVQAVLFVLMKKISKLLLKSVCSDITSYIIKNIIFWMAELLPRHNFTENNLMSLLIDCLKILRETVKRKYLANYMIAKRNLFSGKLEHQEQQNLYELLSTMVEQGPRFLVQYPQLDRLRRRMQLVYLDPEAALFEQISREGLESQLNKESENPLATPFTVPLTNFRLKQRYPSEMFSDVCRTLMQYLLGYYDS